MQCPIYLLAVGSNLALVATLVVSGIIGAGRLTEVQAEKQTERPPNGQSPNLRLPAVPEIAKSKPNRCGSTAQAYAEPLDGPEYETYKLAATYYTLRDGLAATLMLNNKGPQPILATPTFYSLAGTRLVLAPITVPGASYLDVDMHQLLAGVADEFREGSMKIAYTGGQQQLGAQIKIADAGRGLIWAEQFIYTTKFTSSRLESVWWLPYQNSETRLVVSNTSSGTLTATVEVDGTSPQQTTPYQCAISVITY